MNYYAIKEAKAFPIEQILEKFSEKSGEKNGNKTFFSSPFSSDKTPSLCVYKNNSYFDFSNGFGGDSIDLYKRIKGCDFKQAVKELSSSTGLDEIEIYIKKQKEEKNEVKRNWFDKNNYILKDEEDIKKVVEYANSRSIYEGYYPAKIHERREGEYHEMLAMMYVHVDENFKECGGKFRYINPIKNRFNARGVLKMYILENLIKDHYSDPILYIAESESSANSLYEICKKYFISAVVISVGGQTNKIDKLPEKYEWIEKRRLIFDYDGNEEKYNKIIKLHEGLGIPIKIPLEKGEDINSMFSNKKDNLIYKMLTK